ncbi:FAD-dependent oxidoreductase [Micromonospora sp. CPCC 206060]|uniref:NAD(P)/FAD-dependent oxidoreductase n=1 Tax=Micromonospora sp. CPCC 206060 TaxID=3122406 RepID=UPI002FF2C61C
MSDADVVIVGAGIIGCLVARKLNSVSPGLSVMVIDRDAAGNGASRRSAGLHFPRGGTARVREMAAESQDYYTRLRADDPTLPIHPLAMSVLIADSDDGSLRRRYLDRAKLRRVDGVPGDLVTPPENTTVWAGDGCHYADVAALTAALARELRPAVRFREGIEVTAIEPAATEVLLRLRTGESVSTGAVVLAPGPWLHSPAWRELTRPLRSRVKKVVALHVDHRVTRDDGAVVFEDEDAFLLPLVHRDHWLFSYTCQEWDVEPDALTSGLSRANLAEAHDCLGAYSPVLADLATAGRVFCDAYSPSREPIVRLLGDSGRVVFAGAANGSGYRLAPAIATEVAQLLPSQPGQRICA